MLRSSAFLRRTAPLALLLSFAAAVACSDDSDSNAPGSDSGGDGGAGDDGSFGGDGASLAGTSSGGRNPSGGNGATGGDRTTGGNGATGGDGTTGGNSAGGNSAGGDTPLGGEGGSAVAGLGPAPVLLGAAENYVVLAESAISNVPTSEITGNIGLSPAAASYITGFSLTRAGTMWSSPQVTGGVFAANNDPPTPRNLTTAVADMHTAYTDAASRPTPTVLNLGTGTIGGRTLAPGLYRWTSSVTIPADIAISGAPNDVWIFQITGNLSMSAAKRMTLSGGARAKNIVWQVAGLVNFGTTSHAEGIILSKTAIQLGTGASINGRLFAQTAIDIASTTVTAPAP